MLPSESVVIPAATIWIKSGELAGHYVILSEVHYFYPGALRQRPTEDMYTQPASLPKTFGAKAALQSGAISCDFVSYWEGRDKSIIGPITIAKVSG